MVFSNFPTYKQVPGRPNITVSPVGVANGYITNAGADYGPDTPGTSTSGIQEAISASANVTGTGIPVTVLPGTYSISTGIVIDNVICPLIEGYGAQIQWNGTGVCFLLEQAGFTTADVSNASIQRIAGFSIFLNNPGQTGVHALDAEMLPTFQDMKVQSLTTSGTGNIGFRLTGYGDLIRLERCRVISAAAVSGSIGLLAEDDSSFTQPQQWNAIHSIINGWDTGISQQSGDQHRVESCLIQSNTTGIVENYYTVGEIVNTWFESNTTWLSTTYRSGGFILVDSCNLNTLANQGGIGSIASNTTYIRNCAGVNPQGFAITTPSVPTSGSAVTNTTPFVARIYVLTASSVTYTITDPAGNVGPSISASAGSEITLDPGASITPTYTTLTWKWYGE